MSLNTPTPKQFDAASAAPELTVRIATHKRGKKQAVTATAQRRLSNLEMIPHKPLASAKKPPAQVTSGDGWTKQTIQHNSSKTSVNKRKGLTRSCHEFRPKDPHSHWSGSLDRSMTNQEDETRSQSCHEFRHRDLDLFSSFDNKRKEEPKSRELQYTDGLHWSADFSSKDYWFASIDKPKTKNEGSATEINSTTTDAGRPPPNRPARAFAGEVVAATAPESMPDQSTKISRRKNPYRKLNSFSGLDNVASTSPRRANIAIPSDQATKISPKTNMYRKMKSFPGLDDGEPLLRNTAKVNEPKNSGFRVWGVRNSGNERDITSCETTKRPHTTKPSAGFGRAGDGGPRDWNTTEKQSDPIFGSVDEATPSPIVACSHLESMGSEPRCEGPTNTTSTTSSQFKRTEEPESWFWRGRLLNTSRGSMETDGDAKRTEGSIASEFENRLMDRENTTTTQAEGTKQSNASVVDCWGKVFQERAGKESKSLEDFNGGLFELMDEDLMNASAGPTDRAGAGESHSGTYRSRCGWPTCGGSNSAMEGEHPNEHPPLSARAGNRVCTTTKLDDTPPSRVTAALSTRCPERSSSKPRFGQKPAQKLKSDACDATSAPQADMYSDTSADSMGSSKAVCSMTGSAMSKTALPPAPLFRRRLKATSGTKSSPAQTSKPAACIRGGQSLFESSGDDSLSQATGASVAPGANEPVRGETQPSILPARTRDRQTKTVGSDSAEDSSPTKTDDRTTATGRNSRRGTNRKRLEKVLVLMKLAREAETGAGEENSRLREQLSSSGGMQVVLKEFRTGSSNDELKVVSAMAVAYILSSSVKSSSQALGNFGSEILECIRFLSTSKATTTAGETVTNIEAFKASVSGLASFWIYFLEPALSADKPLGLSVDEAKTSYASRDTSTKPRDATAGNDGFVERGEPSRSREVLEMVALVILNAKKSSEISVLKGDPVLTRTNSLVEMVCEKELTRPIAVRAGVVRILVEWIESKEHEKVMTAVRSLRSLASINDRYMEGWIHGQLVSEGALETLWALTQDFSIGGDMRRAIIQTLLPLCVVEPHTREAVAEFEESRGNYDATGAAADHDNDSRTIPGEHQEPESSITTSEESRKEPSTQDLVGSGDNMITILYSAPLVYTDEKGAYKPLPKLDFDMERELMWQCLKEGPRDISLSFDCATHERLLEAMNKRCACLHYSGHGWVHYLSFEDGSGGPHWLRVEGIKHLIERAGDPPFKLVFVSACHSGQAGEIFASAGIPHVVCCQQEFEIYDIAAVQFTRQFYHALFVGRTVKESFEQGCRAVRAMPNIRHPAEEMKKFVLLPEKGNHDVSIFRARPVAESPRLAQNSVGGRRHARHAKTKRATKRTIHDGSGRGSELRLRNMMQENPGPKPPQFFLGREVIAFYVLKTILSKRLVSIVGETGIGRSSLVRFLCHYINKRASTISNIKRICFIRADEGRQLRCRTLLLALSKMLADRGKLRMSESDAELAKTIYSKLTNAKALIVFDHLEYLEDPGEATKLHGFLDKLLEETDATVLVTSRRALGIKSLRGAVEVSFHLDPLNFLNTVELFTNLCPYLHKPSHRIKLQKAVLTDGAEAEMLPSDPRLSASTKKLYKFFGDGIPSRVEKAAAEVSQDDFSALVLEIFGLAGSHTSTMASLSF